MKRESNASPAAEFLAAEVMNTHQIETDKAQKAFNTFDITKEEIIGNTNGGAGFFAEAHHAASCGLTRIGSNEFGSADMVNDDGQAFNPKYYASAEESYKAGAELIKDPITGIETAKYAGDVIVVASDQIDQATALHQQSIQDALNAGNQAQAEALQSISFLDHAYNGKLQSTPLSYEEAQQGRHAFIDGHTPDYAYESGMFSHLESLIESMGVAAFFTLFLSIAQPATREIKRTFNDEETVESLPSRLSAILKSEKVQQDVIKASGRSSLAALLSMSEYIDGIGAGFIVSTGFEAYKLSVQWKDNEITDQEFFDAFKSLVVRNGAWSVFALILFSLTGAGTAVVGLLLTKLAANKLLKSDRLNREIESGLTSTFDASFENAKFQANNIVVQEEIIKDFDDELKSEQELNKLMESMYKGQ